MYTYDESLKASIAYFNDEELSARAWLDKYALRDNNGNILELTPDDTHKRLAKEFARIEKNKFKHPLSEEYIYSLLQNYSCLIPQGSPLYGIGNKYSYTTLSNCYVISSPEDSYGGICRADEELLQISKRRGGVGIDLSELRPIKTPTHNSSRTSTGIVSWMERYSNSIREVGQGGRRGALMLTLSVHHPEIETFISIKNDDTKVTGANISVKLTDEFLNAVANNEDYEQRWPEINPTIIKRVNAKYIWDKIINNAWLRAEPGLLFWDNIIKESIPDCYDNYKTLSTNPCSEIPLSAYDSCRLLAINLFYFIVNPYTKDAYFDYKKFYTIVQIGQRLMDDLVDLELECIDKIINKINDDPESLDIKQKEKCLWEKIRWACRNGRRTGLGITALGDILAALNIKYGSELSIKETEKIYKTLKFGSYRSSIDMAKELGAFPLWKWEKEENNPFLMRFKDEIIEFNDDERIYGDMILKEIIKYGRRNIATLTTAPTGTISTQASLKVKDKLFFNTTSGIEPTIFLDYIRRKKGNHNDKDFRVDFTDKSGDTWMEFKVYHTGIKAWMYATNKTDIDNSCPYHGATATEINWLNRVKLQAVAAKHIDHSISSTINLPNNVTKEEVSKIYETAWEYGLKGITVYRDGCRSGVLIQTKENDRPKSLDCEIHHITVKGQKYFVLVGLKDLEPYEVFAGRNGILDRSIKRGKIVKKRNNFYQLTSIDGDILLAPITATCTDDEEAISRLTSLSLRSGANIHLVVQQLEKVGGEMNSFAKSIARSLKQYIKDGTLEGEECPECKNKNVIRQSGCATCQECGWSKCL